LPRSAVPFLSWLPSWEQPTTKIDTPNDTAWKVLI
jgi:hypothetical protein